MRRVLAGLALVACAVVAACREPEPMPLGPSATWLVESGPSAAGSPFEMLLFVRAPAGHRLHAYAPPEVEGLDVVERRVLPMTTEGRLAVHREALLVRARSPGLHRWPASTVRLTDASGATLDVALDGLDLEVPSVLGEGAPPRRPRGYRDAPSPPGAMGFGAGFAAGAALAGVAAVVLLRRERRRGRDAQAGAAAPTASGRRAFGGTARLERGLLAARAEVAAAPDAAAARAALALRHWAADRFLVATHAGSIEELLHARPARAPEPAWRAWIDALRAIDAARFEAADGAPHGDAIARAIDEALAFAAEVDRATGAGAPGRATP